MMRIFFLLMISWVLSLPAFAQVPENIEFDDHAFGLKDSMDKDMDFDQLIKRINTLCATDTQKLWLMAGWFYTFIEFDLEKFRNGGGSNDYSTIFKQKKGICLDYAVLFSAFCDRLNIENEIIEGYVPEYHSDNTVYYETNHAWNVIQLGTNWYHCDLLGFSGFLNIDMSGGYQFVKYPRKGNFLTRDVLYLSKHIPADPIWQMSHYPIPLDTFLMYGRFAVADSSQVWFDYEAAIDSYRGLSEMDKWLAFADRANDYNKNNSNVLIVNYYNAAVYLINNGDHDPQKWIMAKEYLDNARKYLPDARNGVEALKEEIIRGFDIINKHEH